MGRQSEIGARLRQARLQSTPKITQKDLSARLETMEVYLDPTMLSKIENGKRKVSTEEATKIAQALKVDVRWLLGLID
ncbi:MAG: helix-turn-helix domain-containing protein [Candidatus Pararuminococcus gallinarum]|jgi:transcriptional regulator with XRE-family HTH domain